ncbi:flavodoxin family protein [Conexibacter sp. CPCC 206217]|uniref:flavodoxin family protein n=1 Tax=Conexibacter sp. CPCC 206217 TaxID=3064574 RepID=UPI0027166738|nr:NADPH-dependent FMN reductase [Conexibacter sp. CPCC 206217]MDO8212046.1 NADPH-dependent FMN reductase [Conexibacter sp. CPCC 206217]
MSGLAVVAVIGSADGGTTHTLVGEVLKGAEQAGALTSAFCLGRGEYLADVAAAARERADGADALVLATPMYRSSFTGVLKQFLDELPRVPHGDFESALLGKPVAVVGTGGSDHHYLGIDALLGLLPRFFASYVVPPGLYGRANQIADGHVLDDELAAAARRLGHATVELAAAVAASAQLPRQRPQF